MRTLELLAPAKNLECGIAAIDHGADAVYIGAPRFGARAAAGNSIEDIKQLCDYAHQFGAKVHVTVNTIIYDSELEDTLKMISQLDEIGVDALLLQDMGLLWEVRAKGLWKRELHSSTQCDTRTPEKALWLTQIGFKRVVLARELSLDEIKAIHHAIPDREIEVFVHGALPKGQIIFGAFLGIMTGIFRIIGTGVEGVSFAIILGNLLVPLIDMFTRPKTFGKERVKNVK